MRVRRQLLVVALLLLPLLKLTERKPVGQTLQCQMAILPWNDNRYYYGETSSECTWGCPPLHHSHAFGNWGVDSNFGSRQNSTQFMGWKTGTNPYCTGESISGSKPEWNSCTTSGWQSGNSSYYNYPNGTWTEQRSTTAKTYGVLVQNLNTGEPEGCAYLDEYVMSFTGNYMDMYELDSPGSDTWVTGVVFPNVDVELDCSNYSYCDQAESGWVDNNGPHPSATVRMNVKVDGVLIGE